MYLFFQHYYNECFTMILGLGIDMVDIDRFNDWHLKSHDQLLLLFSPAEIAYSCQYSELSAERFAVRYAAKEAFYKAYCSWQHPENLPLITVCNAVSVAKTTYNVPHLVVNWHVINAPFVPQCTLSLTHSQSVALAHVLLSAHTELDPKPSL